MTTAPMQRTDLDVNEAEDGYVVLSAAGDRVHHLNGPAALVFELCDGDRSAADISALLADSAGMSVSEGEVSSCIATLKERGLLQS